MAVRSGYHGSSSPCFGRVRQPMTSRDTICALSSAPGRAGVAVVRVSGPLAHVCWSGWRGGCRAAGGPSLRTIRDPAPGRTSIARSSCSIAGPSSFTGEDVVEILLHGGRAVVASVLAALSGARMPACGAGRVRAAGVRERQDRSHGGRGHRRSDRCGDGGAAAPGVAQAGGELHAALRGMARGADRGDGADGSGDRFLRRGGCRGGCCAAGARDRRGACAARIDAHLDGRAAR